MKIDEKLIEELERHFNYISINESLLNTDIIPDSFFTIYVVSDGIKSYYFNSLEEREQWISVNKPEICNRIAVEYVGSIAGKENVIREWNDYMSSYRYVSINDDNTYSVYNFEQSTQKGVYVWNNYTDGVGNEYKMLSDVTEMALKLDKKIV